MLCSICFNEIKPVGDWTEGNSASPVNPGRCCNDCDNNVVIPARLAMMANKVSEADYWAMMRQQYDAMRRMFEPAEASA